jgi:hypothetical protein
MLNFTLGKRNHFTEDEQKILNQKMSKLLSDSINSSDLDKAPTSIVIVCEGQNREIIKMPIILSESNYAYIDKQIIKFNNDKKELLQLASQTLISRYASTYRHTTQLEYHDFNDNSIREVVDQIGKNLKKVSLVYDAGETRFEVDLMVFGEHKSQKHYKDNNLGIFPYGLGLNKSDSYEINKGFRVSTLLNFVRKDFPYVPFIILFTFEDEEVQMYLSEVECRELKEKLLLFEYDF